MSPPVEVITGPGRACPRCSRPVLLSAVNAFSRTIIVCETCDVEDPWAGPIIRYFQVRGELQADSVEVFADLVMDWVKHAMPPDFDHASWEAEYQAWQRGEL
jgi:Family of unknown function (DUF6300)